jgi:lysophospholipase L1-like esterase
MARLGALLRRHPGRIVLAAAGVAAGLLLSWSLHVGPFASASPFDGLYRESDDPVLKFELVPGKNGIVNRAGFLGRDYAEEKPDGTFRIVGLGDSVTMNYAPRRENYLAAIEERLPAVAGRPVEVLNLAVGGYATAQEVRRLEVLGLRYRPDLVVVGYCVNDAIGFVRQIERLTGSDHGLRSGTDDGPVQRLLRDAILAVPGLWWEGFQRDYVETGEAWAESLAALDALAVLAARHGFGVVVVLFPSMHRLDDYALAPLHRRLGEEVRARGLAFVDLLPAYRAAGDGPSPGVSALVQEGREDDPIHPNAEGNRIAADALIAWLAEHRPWDRQAAGQ